MRDKPLIKLLWSVAVTPVEIVAPFILAFMIPPWAALGYWIFALISEWIEQRYRHKVHLAQMWVLGANTAITLAAARTVQGTWMRVVVSMGALFVAICLHELWRKSLGLREVASAEGPQLAETNALPARGASAWGGAAPITPIGETVRVIGCTEIAMGGPLICDYLFPDGSVIRGCGCSTGFSSDGRYFVSPIPSRAEWGLFIFDRQKHMLYRCDVDAFWEIDEVNDMSIVGRSSPLTSDKSYMALIDDLIGHSRAEAMVSVVDLSIPQSDWSFLQSRARDVVLPAPPVGGPNVVPRPYLPERLAALENPLAPLLYPQAELLVDGTASGLLLSCYFPSQFVWREDGQAFACSATRTEKDATSRYYLWQSGKGWQEIPDENPLSATKPYVRREGAICLDSSDLTVKCHMSVPSLSHETFGCIDRFVHDAAYEVNGETFRPPIIYEKLPLEAGSEAAVHFESEPLRNGLSLIWRLVRIDKDLSRAICHCSLGDRVLDGEWLLEHRISPDRRYVSLVAHSPAPAIPHRIAILHVETGLVRWTDDAVPDPWLIGFGKDAIHLLQLTGRVNESPDGTDPAYKEPPVRFDDEVPPCDKARSFLHFRGGSSLCYRVISLKRIADNWRVVDVARKGA